MYVILLRAMKWCKLRHKLEGGAMMDYVLMIILAIAVVIYPKKNVFIDKFKFKALGLHIEISAKEKNCPPAKKDSSNQ